MPYLERRVDVLDAAITRWVLSTRESWTCRLSAASIILVPGPTSLQ